MNNITSQVTFNKEKYHLNGDMQHWCEKHIGQGGWTYGTPGTWEGMGNKIWVMYSMFGNTTFVFKDPKHLTMFLLRWQ